METYCVCVHSGSGAMGKVSKTVAAVVSVAVCYTVPNVSYEPHFEVNIKMQYACCEPLQINKCLKKNVSYVGIIATSTLPRPCPVNTLTSVYMCVSVTSDLMCVSSV